MRYDRPLALLSDPPLANLQESSDDRGTPIPAYDLDKIFFESFTKIYSNVECDQLV